jgi:uncharacterized membrane protein
VRLGILTLALALSAVPSAVGQQGPADESPRLDPSDLVNTLLGALMGGPADGASLQKDVQDAGGIPFRQDVPIAFLNRAELTGYLRELFDAEYPLAQARADERLLRAFDLLPEATDLRALRARVLEENVVGFYDDRPDKRRLYAVSEDRSFTPMNQIVLVHELRHALQDQYAELHQFVSGSSSDFDDRRLAAMSLYEGDATLVMERFMRSRLGALGSGTGEADVAMDGAAAGLGAAGLVDIPGAPPVVRDQLVQPYLVGLTFAKALWAGGGAGALREAWSRPPASTEQVLHPELYSRGEAPRSVLPRVAAPKGATAVSEGVLGELLLRTLLEPGNEAAAAGWGADGWRLWDVRGATALAWRSEWDTPADAVEFHDSLRGRFARHHGPARAREGWESFGGTGRWWFAIRKNGDGVELVSADDTAVFSALLGSGPSLRARLAELGLDIGGGSTRVPATTSEAEATAGDPAQGGEMATSTPSGNQQTNLGMAPNVAGLLCYVPCCIGLVFSVVAAIVEKQSRLVRFHAFQSLLLHAAAIVVGIGLQVLNVVFSMAGVGILGLLLSLLGLVVGLGLLGVSIFLMVKANAGEELELPVIGPMARGWV